MNSTIKKILITLLIALATTSAMFLIYTGYQAVIAHATAEIRQGVTQGVHEGMSGGIVKFLNPFGALKSRKS